MDRIQSLIDQFQNKHGRKPEAILISTDLLKQMDMDKLLIQDNPNSGNALSNWSGCRICGLCVKPLKASKDCIEIV